MLVPPIFFRIQLLLEKSTPYTEIICELALLKTTIAGGRAIA